MILLLFITKISTVHLIAKTSTTNCHVKDLFYPLMSASYISK